MPSINTNGIDILFKDVFVTSVIFIMSLINIEEVLWAEFHVGLAMTSAEFAVMTLYFPRYGPARLERLEIRV